MAQVRSRVSRRSMLLGLASGAAVTAGVVATSGITDSASFPNLLGPAALGPTGGPLANAGYADWKAQVGSSFKTHTGHVLQLVSVQAFPVKGARPRDLRDRAFAARFDITSGGTLADDLYRVVHREGGIFDIFLTKGSADTPLRMLAVFN